MTPFDRRLASLPATYIVVSVTGDTPELVDRGLVIDSQEIRFCDGVLPNETASLHFLPSMQYVAKYDAVSWQSDVWSEHRVLHVVRCANVQLI